MPMAIWDAATEARRKTLKKEIDDPNTTTERLDEIEAEMEKINGQARRAGIIKGIEDGTILTRVIPKPDGHDERRMFYPDNGEIRFLRHTDRFSDHVKGDLPDGLQAEELSIGRMVRSLVRGSWKDAEAEKRALQGQVAPQGGYFLPEPLSARLIDMSRARMVTSEAGAVTIPVEADSLKIPKILADPAVFWRGELEQITESDPTFGSITLVPKVCAVLVKISHELYEDGKAVGETVEQVIAAALAQEQDRVVLLGGGTGNTNEPVGVYYTDGISTVEMGTNGADLTDYDVFLDAVEMCEEANIDPSAAIYNPRTKRDLAGLVTGITSDLTKLTMPEDFKNLRRLVTTSIPNDQAWGIGANCTCAFVGGFPAVWIGLRNQIRMEVSPHGTGVFDRLALWVRAYIRMDVAVVRPKELTRITGITTSRGE